MTKKEIEKLYPVKIIEEREGNNGFSYLCKAQLLEDNIFDKKGFEIGKLSENISELFENVKEYFEDLDYNIIRKEVETEIRKPLEDEIEKIKSTRIPASIPDGVALHYKQENAVINKAKQEVIDELLEWIKKQEDIEMEYWQMTGVETNDYNFLKQKLNEMKEVE